MPRLRLLHALAPLLAPLLAPPLAAAALAAAPARAGAQGRPLSVRGQRGMTLGNVLPGVPVTIRFTDGTRAAQFDVSGVRGAEVEMRFALPSALVGPGNVSMSMTFGPGTAGLSLTGNPATASPRDPAAPFNVVLTSTNARAYVFLGGTASPTSQQQAGAYAGTVLLTAAYTGL